MIEKNGYFQSSVGRPAVAYSTIPKAYSCIGVEIQENRVRILAIDLYGNPFEQTELEFHYSNDSHYYKVLSSYITTFIKSLKLTKKQVLGISFAIQALTSNDGQKITYGKILNCTGLDIHVFSQYLDYPCMFVHDAKCAAFKEMWVRKDLENALYLSIGPHLGGAVIINRQIYMGKEGLSGTFEHMTLLPNGPACYCGKKGCMETYSSVNALLKEEETLDIFFKQVRSDVSSYVKRWYSFLDHLAFAISNLHLVINREVILGGHISPYLNEQDIEILHDKIHQESPFPIKEPFISISQAQEDSVATGAAIPFIQSFLDDI
ncbi:ROK family protein [Clostridium sp. 1xD42-85]|uniref:ROK family protein n=1 Tax=Clostridium sp. 1xD42-85 TaxID=2320084 RepID=UPI002ED640BB